MDNDAKNNAETKMNINDGLLRFYLGVIIGALAAAVITGMLVSPNGFLNRAFFGGSEDGVSNINAPPRVTQANIESKVGEILHVLSQHYIGELDTQELIDDMFRGLVYGVRDVYTVYFTMAEFEEYMRAADGRFVGIGVSVSVNSDTNMIEIIAPHEGSPGQEAGLAAGDKIIAVNGYSVHGGILRQAIDMIRGIPGTTVNLTIQRGNENFDIDIVRDHIVLPSVMFVMLEDDKGYIRITQFADNTDEQFHEALTSLLAQGMRGLVVDVRNNPGGRLDTVLSIADALVPEGVIMYMEMRSGPTEYKYTQTAEYLGLPLVVLVNGSSASASEVLAGAIKDTGVGSLVGETTFGKGVVQNFFPLSCGTGALKVTVARYFTPGGAVIHDVGIEPHFRVEMDNNISIAALERNDDTQLQMAVQVLAGKIN